MKEKQLELFNEPKSEISVMWEALEKLKVSQNKMRKRLFAEVGDLQEQVITLRAENERLKFHSGSKIRWSA